MTCEICENPFIDPTPRRSNRGSAVKDSLSTLSTDPTTGGFSASVPVTTPSIAIRRMSPSEESLIEDANYKESVPNCKIHSQNIGKHIPAGDNLFQWLHAILHNPSCIEEAPNVMM